MGDLYRLELGREVQRWCCVDGFVDLLLRSLMGHLDGRRGGNLRNDHPVFTDCVLGVMSRGVNGGRVDECILEERTGRRWQGEIRSAFPLKWFVHRL